MGDRPRGNSLGVLLGSLFTIMEKIIGTHNTMSYLTPKHWWLKPFNWLFAKCQNDPFSKSLIKYSIVCDIVKCVDLRIYWNEKSESWHIAHGLIDYGAIRLIDLIEEMIENDIKYIRIILERDGGENLFFKTCKNLEMIYGNDVTFLGGNRKSDWKQIYEFTNILPIHQWVGSMAEDARWYEKFIPRLYAKRMNKQNMRKLKEGINLFDFI